MSWQIDRQVHRATRLLELDWLEHGFGTAHSHDWNRQDDLVSLSQIHSDICLVAEGGEGRIGRGDAILTNVPGLRIGVRTADCVPVLIADPVRRAVAAVHAGWRGTAQAIVEKAILAMRDRYGAEARDLWVAVGPSVGRCCYRVGAEVAAQFARWFPERRDLDGPVHLDLREANRRQAVAAGVPPERISVSGACTACSGEEFYSWRRQPEEPRRMVNSIRILK